MTLNPDFRGADEVQVPNDLENKLGWTDGRQSEQDAIDEEKRGLDALQDDFPVAFRSRGQQQVMPAMLEKWNAFQESKGRFPGSADWSLLDEFVHGSPLVWLPQIIGSCVCSNTFRAYTIRQMFQVVLQGRAEEYFGRNEFGPQNFAFYCPVTYGLARRRANMRGGDGLYCKPMAETLLKDGVLMCDTPALIDLLKRVGADGQRDFPEPQSARLYRQFGDWRYLDELSPYLDFPVLESQRVTNAQQLWDLQQDCKPTFVCSMEAIHKVGTHRDGFAIHARNPRDRWAHNMACHGAWIASDGERFFRWSNESWGGNHIYNRRFDEVEQSFRAGRLTMQSIGEIRGPSSSPPQV